MLPESLLLTAKWLQYVQGVSWVPKKDLLTLHMKNKGHVSKWAGKYPEGLKEGNKILRGSKKTSTYGTSKKISKACILLNIKIIYFLKRNKTQKRETNEHICLAWLKGLFEPLRNPLAFGNLTKLMQIAKKHKVQQAIGKEWMRRGWKDYAEEKYLKSHRSCF